MSGRQPVNLYVNTPSIVSKFSHARIIHDKLPDLFIGVIECIILYRPEIGEEFISVLSSRIPEPAMISVISNIICTRDLNALDSPPIQRLADSIKPFLNGESKQDPSVQLMFLLNSSMLLIIPDKDNQKVQHFNCQGRIDPPLTVKMLNFLVVFIWDDEQHR